jgi:uncharacterized protein (DUF2126 family)/transglutaminase-like putative cysteine protease
MPVHVAISHTTEYAYDRPVSLSPHVIRLRPGPHCRTPVLAYALKVTPARHFITWQQDPHGNFLARVAFSEPTRALSITVDLVAEMAVYNPFDFFLEPSAEHAPFEYDQWLQKELAAFLDADAPGDALASFLASTDRRPQRTTAFLVGLNRRLSEEIQHIVRLEPGVQSPEETLTTRLGSCRDTAWLLVQVLRHLGFAARFVSGYLVQLAPDVQPLEGPAGVTADFTDLHAWAEVYLPGAGWLGLDPTSGLLAGEGHLPVAATPDPQSAAPVSGSVEACEVTFRHEMHIQRIYESPRVTKPYTDGQWSEIVSLGRRIDRDLLDHDVRLTMGGVPTFIGIDDMDGAEWNVATLGTRKRELAGQLMTQLRQRLGPGGLLHYGQGQCAGEPEPRWSIGCVWRRDGQVLWHDEQLLADETRDYGFDANDGTRFGVHLAGVLGDDGSYARPAVERQARVAVESRHGRLHVVVPPVADVEAYFRIAAAVERTARDLALPVILEGAPPPPDPRLDRIIARPDRGVIRVSMHPARSWDELVEQTTVLYEAARQSRLGADKFMIDGRHTGTGGGHHIVIGGPTATDSPVLRRPDLIRSLLAYWNNHPSLSYLFSGQFVGPASPHPRIDESRPEALHELEIAFQQMATSGTADPSLVGRIFRSLLADATGDTQRTEFRLDRLFEAGTADSVRGLAGLRSFEMAPHARMSLTQQLLVRAIVSAFWKEPYSQGVVRWGSGLRDRFMLPHFLQQDVEDVLEDLGRRGYALRAEWFAPHFEFRFPFHGTVVRGGVRVELRQAIEPWWPVPAADPGAETAVRYIDSSVERVQVMVTGLTPERHCVTCNGRRVPLHPTGTSAEAVAGVRYRAWLPAHALHPTVPVHAPLTFDVVDIWNRRSLGGCVYHVTHPGGRNYETFPVNAYEAESRRRARFLEIGHTSGTVDAPPAEHDADFPFTLDLRRTPRHDIPQR